LRDQGIGGILLAARRALAMRRGVRWTESLASSRAWAFTLNETGRAIWERLDGKKSLKDVVADLSQEFDAKKGEIEMDVIGLVEELVKRKMVVEVK